MDEGNKMKMNDSPHKDAYQTPQQGALPTLYNSTLTCYK